MSKIFKLLATFIRPFRLYLSNFSAFSAIQAVSYLIPIITVPYFARVLTIAGLGQIAVANAVAMAGGVIIDYGILQSGARYAASHGSEPEALNRYLIATSALKTLLFTGIAAVFCLAALVVPQVREHFVVYLWSIASAGTAALFPLWLFQGLLIVPKAARILVTTRFLAAGSAFALIRSPADTYVVPMTQAIAALIALIAAGMLFRRSLPLRSNGTAKADIKILLRDNWKLFSATAWGIVHAYGTIIIIGVMLPAQSVGFYSIAERISQAFVSLFNIAAQTLFPTLVRRFARGDEGFARMVKMYLLSVAGISALMLGVIFFMRETVYSFFAGQHNAAGITIFTIWLFASFFTVICVSLSPVMVAMHRDRSLASIYRFTGLTFLVLAPVLVRAYGVVGMAFAALFPQLFMGLYFVVTVNRALRSGTLPINP